MSEIFLDLAKISESIGRIVVFRFLCAFFGLNCHGGSGRCEAMVEWEEMMTGWWMGDGRQHQTTGMGPGPTKDD